MLRRIPCYFGSGIGPDKGGVNPRIALEDRAQVAKLLPRITLNIEHINLLIYDPNTLSYTIVFN